MSCITTVTGSYPRKEVQKDTLRKSSVSDEESFEMIKWAVKEQSDLGLDIITDGEGYRENMYWFYQLRLDGVDAINKIRKDFTLGGSTKGVDLSKTHGTKGFGIECAVIKDEIKNLKTGLAKKWRIARDNTPSNIRVKQTITGPHMLSRFSVNERTDLYPDDIALAMKLRGFGKRFPRGVTFPSSFKFIHFIQIVFIISSFFTFCRLSPGSDRVPAT